MTSLLAFALMMKSDIPPLGPLPTKSQLAWQNMEMNAFVHFGPNTFTDVEWGGGNEDPNLFNPTALDCGQWVRTLKQAGFKGVIITAKHHDGFCLWPSKLSTHTVAFSKWKDGKGDVLKELSQACRHYGLKMGVYLSPWDRNHPTYGTPAYNQVFVGMLKEVLTNYGPIFEVWFDGANGEGPNGKNQVYDWPLFHATVRKYQPNAVMFSDAGPDIRWVGNEEGHAGLTSWSMIPSGRYHPGTALYAELSEGSASGDLWVPAECDVSIRPGWFYHPHEEDKNRTPDNLLNLYEASVGRNSLLLLNIPPDRRGQFTAGEISSLLSLKPQLESIYGINLAKGARLTSSSASLSHEARALNQSPRSYWASQPQDEKPWVQLSTAKPTSFNRVVLSEPIWLGQRIKSFSISTQSEDGTWQTIAEGTTVGRKRIVITPKTTAKQIRVTISGSRANPVALSRFSLHLAP